MPDSCGFDEESKITVYIPQRKAKPWAGSSFVRGLLDEYGIVHTSYKMLDLTIADYSWEEKSNARYLKDGIALYDDLLWDRATKYFVKVNNIIPDGSVDILSPQDALKLVPQDTHPGYPFENKFVKKKTAIEAHSVLLLMCMSLTWFGTLIARSARKVEMRKAQHFVDQKVRTVFMMCVCAIANGIRLFHNLMERMKETYRHTPYWVGRSRYYGGADELRRSLRKHGLSGDASGMDGSLLQFHFEFLYKWKVSKLKAILGLPAKVFWYMVQILSSLLVDSSGRVHLKSKGNVSGQYCTTSDNTKIMENAMYYSLMWNGISEERINTSHPDSFVFKNGGDDVILTHESIDALKALDLVTPMAQLGITFRIEHPPDLVENCPFLGDCFRYLPNCGMFVPVPKDLSKMYCAWAEHCKTESPLMNYIRTWNFYIMCYWDEKFREIALEALRRLRPDSAHPHDRSRVRLSETLVLGDQVIRADVQLRVLDMTPEEILFLYTGWQAKNTGRSFLQFSEGPYKRGKSLSPKQSEQFLKDRKSRRDLIARRMLPSQLRNMLPPAMEIGEVRELMSRRQESLLMP